MRRYVGRRMGATDTTVTVVDDHPDGTTTTFPLEHHVQHSPGGFQWGYGGSGPSELARCILWDYLKGQPDPACYQDFKAAFLVNAGDDLEIIDSEIATWLADWAWQHPSRPALAGREF